MARFERVTGTPGAYIPGDKLRLLQTIWVVQSSKLYLPGMFKVTIAREDGSQKHIIGSFALDPL